MLLCLLTNFCWLTEAFNVYVRYVISCDWLTFSWCQALALHTLIMVPEGCNISLHGVPPLHMVSRNPALLQQQLARHAHSGESHNMGTCLDTCFALSDVAWLGWHEFTKACGTTHLRCCCVEIFAYLCFCFSVFWFLLGSDIPVLGVMCGICVIVAGIHTCRRFISGSLRGRNSSVGSAWARCPQRRGFDPPLGIFSGSGDFSLGVNMGSNSIPPKTLLDESINRGLVRAHMHFIARTQKILTFMS